MDDPLKKLGYRLRPRVIEKQRGGEPGKIAFDDRGNALYEWTDDRLGTEGEEGERLRSRALEHPGLSLVDDEPAKNAPVRFNPKGLRIGYDPYESGMLAKKSRKRKVDLHELSKWIDQKRKLNGRKDDE